MLWLGYAIEIGQAKKRNNYIQVWGHPKTTQTKSSPILTSYLPLVDIFEHFSAYLTISGEKFTN